MDQQSCYFWNVYILNIGRNILHRFGTGLFSKRTLPVFQFWHSYFSFSIFSCIDSSCQGLLVDFRTLTKMFGFCCLFVSMNQRCPLLFLLLMLFRLLIHFLSWEQIFANENTTPFDTFSSYWNRWCLKSWKITHVTFWSGILVGYSSIEDFHLDSNVFWIMWHPK